MKRYDIFPYIEKFNGESYAGWEPKESPDGIWVKHEDVAAQLEQISNALEDAIARMDRARMNIAKYPNEWMMLDTTELKRALPTKDAAPDHDWSPWCPMPISTDREHRECYRTGKVEIRPSPTKGSDLEGCSHVYEGKYLPSGRVLECMKCHHRISDVTPSPREVGKP